MKRRSRKSHAVVIEPELPIGYEIIYKLQRYVVSGTKEKYVFFRSVCLHCWREYEFNVAVGKRGLRRRCPSCSKDAGLREAGLL